MSAQDNNKIKCPKCGEYFEPSEAFRHQLEDQIKIEFDEKLKSAVKTAEEKAISEHKAKASVEMEDLKKQLEERDTKLKSMKDEELKLREEKRKVEEAKADLELEVQRKLDEERKAIEEKAFKKAEEEHKYKDLEKDKVINDLNKALDEAKRKAQQGSQQLQGEVLELDFEQTLRDTFRNDDIRPVEKGVKGADVKQTVVNKGGLECGIILWENKRTKSWSEGWIEKLKADLRNEKANIPVIVTSALPNDTHTPISFRNGVYVTTFNMAIPLAHLLRKNLLDVGYQKAVSAHRGEKADNLYEYITGHEFRQQVEAMVDSYMSLKTQITKERIAYEKMWKERETQIDKLLISTANVVGSIQGEVGGNLLQIKGLDLPQLEESNLDEASQEE